MWRGQMALYALHVLPIFKGVTLFMASRSRSNNNGPRPFSNETLYGRGNLTADPFRISAENKVALVIVRVACNSQSIDADGEVVEGTNYRNLKLFGSLAEDALATLHKGDSVEFRGRIFPTEWEDKDTGEIREGEEILVDSLSLSLYTAAKNFGDDDASSSRTSRKSGKKRRSRIADVDDDVDNEVEEDFDDDDDLEEAPRPARKKARARRSRTAEGSGIDDYSEPM